jgi:hypothetical protein
MQNSVQCNACHELTHARVNCKPAHLSHSWLRTPAPPFVGSHAKRESPHVHTHTHTCKPAHLSHSWLRKPAPPFVGSNRWRGSKPTRTHSHTRVNLRTSAIPGSESLRLRSWDQTGGGGQSPCPQASGRPGKSGTEHQPLG